MEKKLTMAKKILIAMGTVLDGPDGKTFQTPGLIMDGKVFPHHITDAGVTVVKKYGEYYEVTITILADDVEFSPFGVEAYCREETDGAEEEGNQ